MRTAVLSVFAALVLGACAAGQGVSVATNPKTYLAEFPIGMPKTKLLSELGVPDNETTVDGDPVWSYVIGRDMGKRRYSFVLKDGAVYNVLYNDQGPYNGLTARGIQGLD